MSKKPDYYAVLGVSPNASAKDIKLAYRALAKQYHPDLGGDAAKLAAVNEAADVLADAERRKAYDAERLNAPKAAPAAGGAGKAPTPPPAPEAKPPKKPTVALCEYCESLNRVQGDPRYYPAKCGKCGRPLGGKAGAAAAEPTSAGTDPFEAFNQAASEAPTQARCPHCQMRNRVTGGPGRPITCGSCGREYMPGTGEVDADGEPGLGFGRALGDLANTLFGANADTTTRGMRFAEDRLREMADELRRRREDLERRRG